MIQIIYPKTRNFTTMKILRISLVTIIAASLMILMQRKAMIGAISIKTRIFWEPLKT